MGASDDAEVPPGMYDVVGLAGLTSTCEGGTIGVADKP